MSDVEDRPEDTEHAPSQLQPEAAPPEGPRAGMPFELPPEAVSDALTPGPVPDELSPAGERAEPPPPEAGPDEVLPFGASADLPPEADPDEVALPAASSELPPDVVPGGVPPAGTSSGPPPEAVSDALPPGPVPDEPPPAGASGPPPEAVPAEVALLAASSEPPPELVPDEVAPLAASSEVPPGAATEPQPSAAAAGWPPLPAWAGDAAEDHGWPVPPRRPETETPYRLPAPPQPEARAPERPPVRHSRNPVDRLTRGLPDPLRITIDWVVTILGAVVIVLLVKAFVVNPYRIPSSSMETTLHCAKPSIGCEARYSDRVLANRFLYRIRDPRRGEIIVFKTPPSAQVKCGAGGTFVKRLIGLPGDRVELRLRNGEGYVYINGKPLTEPYMGKSRRGAVQSYGPVTVKEGTYFMMGDNRTQSCDSRMWGTVPRENLIGKVFATYWPPNRISLH